MSRPERLRVEPADERETAAASPSPSGAAAQLPLEVASDASPALAWLDATAGGRPLPEATRVALALLSWWCRGTRLSAAERARLWQQGVPQQDALVRANIDSLLYLACEIDAPVQRLYRRIQSAQRAAAVRTMTALTAAGVDALVCKSAELVPRLAGADALHAAQDVDLLVQRAELGRARRVLHEIGFLQAGVDDAARSLVDLDPLDVAAAERGHYELFPFRALAELELTGDECAAARLLCRGPATAADGSEQGPGPLHQRIWLTDDDRAVLVLEIDLHHRLAHEWDVDRLFARAVPSCLGVGRTLATTDHLWVVALRYYYELARVGYRSLRPLALVGRLVTAPDVDWDLACRVVVALHSAPALYYVLAFLERLAPGRVPGDVLARLDPVIVDRRHDHGWRLARTFDFVDPFPLES
jgi:Uncharacterised nucleotidyltransferase